MVLAAEPIPPYNASAQSSSGRCFWPPPLAREFWILDFPGGPKKNGPKVFERAPGVDELQTTFTDSFRSFERENRE